MAKLQILEIYPEDETVVVLWDDVLILAHHMSDSGNYIERLKEEYPKTDIAKFKLLVDHGLEEPMDASDYEMAQAPVEFEYAPPVINTDEDIEEYTV